MADKVEHIAGVIGDPSTWEVHEEGGELVTVPNPSGIGMRKMRKSEAIRLGLWKDEERGAKSEEGKAQQPKRNKMRKQAENK